MRLKPQILYIPNIHVSWLCECACVCGEPELRKGRMRETERIPKGEISSALRIIAGEERAGRGREWGGGGADLWDEVACWGAVCDIVGVFETNGCRDRGDVKQMKNLERKASFRTIPWWNKCISIFVSQSFHFMFSIFQKTCNKPKEIVFKLFSYFHFRTATGILRKK